MNNRSKISQEVLLKALREISDRNYQGIIDRLLDDFGLSRAIISRHLKEATMEQLKEIQARSLMGVNSLAIFLDGYHIGSQVFIEGLAVDEYRRKHVLGFWEGATESHEVSIELLNNLEDRGLEFREENLFVIDGGKGLI